MRVWAVRVLWALVLVGGAAGAAEPEAVSFIPQGTVKGVRQASARFTTPMVPLGDPRTTAPFDIVCPERGTSRWIDSRTWVHDFVRDLPAGIRCTFSLRAGLTTLAGAPLAAQQFTFSTGGPAIRSSTPYEGDEHIAEEQAFVLILDAEPDRDSVLAHAYFAVEGMPERISVRLIDGAARRAILKAIDEREKPAIVLRARRRFPNAATVRLVWGKGVATVSGVGNVQDQTLAFVTRKAFSAEVRCERLRRDAPCLPLTPITVEFSAPIRREHMAAITLTGSEGRVWRPETSEQDFVDTAVFKGPFPESSRLTVALPRELRDDAGRVLANARKFPLTLQTDAFPPLAKFSARFGIVEWKADPTLPVTVRNLEPEVVAKLTTVSGGAPAGLRVRARRLFGRLTGNITRLPPDRLEGILPWLRRVGSARRSTSIFKPGDATRPFKLPRGEGQQALEVVGIPFASPGLYVVELESPRLGAALLPTPGPLYVPAAVLVTNLSVHLKWGHENALVWVTTLDRGRSVAGARVTIHDCRGNVRWQGETDAQGLALVHGLPPADKLPTCYESREVPASEADVREYYYDAAQTTALSSLTGGLFVVAQHEDDLSFVHSSWRQGIEAWRFQLPSPSWAGPLTARTVFDRALFRAGETVHMKHVLRNKSVEGFVAVPSKERPKTLSIRHAGSDEKYEQPLEWDAAGIAESSWEIPRQAKLGQYEVVMVGGERKEWPSGTFQVQEFRVPLMKATLRLPAEPQVAASAVPADVSVQYLAGGAAEGLPVVLRAQIRDGVMPRFEDFDGFVFGNGPVKEGIIRRGSEEDDEEPERKPSTLQHQKLALDAAGTARTKIAKLPRSGTLREMLAELEYRDPNGEVQTVAATVPLWPSRWLVGLKPEAWAASRDRLRAHAAVVDGAGKPVAEAKVRVDLLEQKTFSHRKRLVGGFYAYEHVEETRAVGPLCRGRTNAQGILVCEGKPPRDGNLVLQASLTDDAGHPSAAHAEVWVAGSSGWWFRVHDSDRIDLLPEKRRYEPGETARLQVRMPFRDATALVTVEREGVIDSRVVPLAGSEPVIEVPIKGHYAPNAFISVLAVRGRVGDVQPTAMLDLGKPAFKLGIAELRVGWRAHELKVSVAADRAAYQVRDKARVTIAVEPAAGAPLPKDAEVAVAAVDEGLLELLPNRSWNLLDAMMGRRGYAVTNATAQSQVVGKRHYGLKALPQGGGGGQGATRELFDTLLLWHGRLPLDAAGRASLEVPLNDSLTSFRIVAVATAGLDRFGTGATTIRATRDLMVLPGLAPLVREGDRFRAEFTVRNASERPMDVVVRGRVEDRALEPETLALASGAAQVVGWDVTAPPGRESLPYEVEATARDGATDRVRATQTVREAVPVRTVQATLLRAEAPIQVPIERPHDALPGRGGIQVGLAPTLAAGLDTVRDHMRRYPYTCLEQQVSRAVALRDEALWKRIVASLPSFVDGDGLLKFFPTMGAGSEVLTAYVVALTPEAGLALPEELRGRLVNGLRGFVTGTVVRVSPLPTADLSIRKLAAIDALAAVGQASPDLVHTIAVEPNLWPTSALLDWWRILRRVPGIPEREARLREAEQIVRARLDLQGTMLGFPTGTGEGLWWLMACPDANDVRLLRDVVEAGTWTDDIPRLVRGALARQGGGTWDCTTSNAWGTLAVERFARTFEATPVGGTTAVSLGSNSQRAEWPRPPRAMTLAFPWPDGRAELALAHAGDGVPWVSLTSRAAIPLTAPLEAGYRITKTVVPNDPKTPGRLSRGDVLRVRLEIDAQRDMTWVVVNDPIPAGASHLGTGLARDSAIATEDEKRDGCPCLAFEERAFEGYRAYYEYVPKGRFSAEYSIRLNQVGRFALPPTRVEALYAPEVFGELPNAAGEVLP